MFLRTLLVGIALALSTAGNVAWASEAAHEHDAKEMSEHMKAMHQVKERISEEYKIMDRTPVIPTPKSLERGKTLYAKFCAVCHGESGAGDGPAAAAMTPRPANFLDATHSAIYGPGEKFWILGNGSGETGMPGFSAQIDLVDRWHLINFILSLQGEGKGARGERGESSGP